MSSDCICVCITQLRNIAQWWSWSYLTNNLLILQFEENEGSRVWIIFQNRPTASCAGIRLGKSSKFSSGYQVITTRFPVFTLCGSVHCFVLGFFSQNFTAADQESVQEQILAEWSSHWLVNLQLLRLAPSLTWFPFS